MSPATGPIATGVALALAVALGLAASSWEAQRVAYEHRIDLLQVQARATTVGLRTELAACHAAGAAKDVPVETNYAAHADAPAGARRLLEREPEGIDACARMESADRAVLSNLKK